MTGERVVVSGGTIVDPASGVPRPGDLVIDDDRIAGIAPPGGVPAEGRVIDAKGLLVLPGLVDMQTVKVHGSWARHHPADISHPVEC